MKRSLIAATASALLLGSALSARAIDMASPADAQQRLSAIVAMVKAKGPDKAGDEIMNGDPLNCKFKDMSCLLITDGGKFIANTSQPALIGKALPMDMTDPDGKPIIAAQVGPAKAGKTKWDAKFKFANPGTKAIVPRWSFCEKAAEGFVACTVIGQQ